MVYATTLKNGQHTVSILYGYHFLLSVHLSFGDQFRIQRTQSKHSKHENGQFTFTLYTCCLWHYGQI